MNLCVESVLACESKEEQLEVAIFLLRTLTADDEVALAHYKARFALSRRPAQVLHYIAMRAPRPCSADQIVTAVYGARDEQPESAIIRAFTYLIRQGIKPVGAELKAVRGAGWALSVEHAALVLPPPDPTVVPAWRPGRASDRRDREPWTEAERQELISRRNAGWDWWALSEEHGRTQRALAEQYYRRPRTAA